VRRVFHKLHARAIESFNNLFKSVLNWHSQVPVKGLRRSQRLAPSAIFICQRAALFQCHQGLTCGAGLVFMARLT
jgi:hypothetical protein